MGWVLKTSDVSITGNNSFTGTNTFTDVIITGTLTTAGIKRAVRVVTVSGNVAVTALDDIVIINKAFTEATKVDFPTGITGKEFTIKDGRGNASTSNITVSAGQNIDSTTVFVINTNFNSGTFVFNGTQYNVI